MPQVSGVSIKKKKKKDVETTGESPTPSSCRYVFNNYNDRSPGSVTAMLEKLERTSLDDRRRHSRLGMHYRINDNIVDINPTNFIDHSGSRRQCL